MLSTRYLNSMKTELKRLNARHDKLLGEAEEVFASIQELERIIEATENKGAGDAQVQG
jgi:hypothetical protein